MYMIFVNALGWLIARITSVGFINTLLAMILSKLAVKIIGAVAMGAAAHYLFAMGFTYLPATYQATMQYFGFNDALNLILGAAITRATYWML